MDEMWVDGVPLHERPDGISVQPVTRRDMLDAEIAEVERYANEGPQPDDGGWTVPRDIPWRGAPHDGTSPSWISGDED